MKFKGGEPTASDKLAGVYSRKNKGQLQDQTDRAALVYGNTCLCLGRLDGLPVKYPFNGG
ncbi:hypothetical protein [Paenibacillus periandrae]|uniref:hypothetical protein n=1 Tax=Paenibacillus periandrae TaxID=1761741 RepID=UPI001F08F030|nr:hypothetical protein [Paenibacillus periandrae]